MSLRVLLSLGNICLNRVRCFEIALPSDAPATTKDTATSIIAMPDASRPVIPSSKSSMPMITAVTGSIAPRIAVGVDPIAWMAIVVQTSDMMVGKTASSEPKRSTLDCHVFWFA